MEDSLTPKYLDKIKAITDSGILSLASNYMLIELLEEGERTSKSGLITNVVTSKTNFAADRARVAVVLTTGPGYITEEGEPVDVKYKPGDHVLVNQFAAKTFGDFFGIADYKSDSIGLITEDMVQGRISDFSKFTDILRG